jgi:hypothetical protein
MLRKIPQNRCPTGSLNLASAVAHMFSVLFLALLTVLAAAPIAYAEVQPISPSVFHAQLDDLPIVDEIDTADTPPIHESPAGASSVTNLLGRAARILTPGESAKCMAWVIGKGDKLQAGQTYMLSIEFPDDVPRTIFIANRGADLVRGFATGTATGDVRQQYTQPSLESLDYPQTEQWQRYRTLFVLHHHFQGLKSQRDPKPNGRPFGPKDGFHVILFQSRSVNDPRSQGVAVGKIRLHAVPDLAQLSPPVPALPTGLPRRHVFFREEMGDEPISAAAADDRACPDPVDWYLAKARISRCLGFNTFAKDLLEFGHNQGWDSGDQDWIVNAQPPLTDLWDRLISRLGAEGMEILPYYEYKGALGLSKAPKSLGNQRRAEKLYHGKPNTNYTGVWWVEQHNADLTDPDCLADAKRVLDATILKHKSKASFAGAWFRTRGNHLPISFSEKTIERFHASFPGDQPDITRQDLINSYEGDGKLYSRYVEWWLDARAVFLKNLRAHLVSGLGYPATLLFTPWTSEPVPLLRDPQSGVAGHPVQIVTDDCSWWEKFARAQPDSSWFRWAYVPADFTKVMEQDLCGRSLSFRERITPLPWRTEDFHAAPNADPERYQTATGVMLTFPIGRLFTVATPALLEKYRSAEGLTIVRHYPLNEDNPDDASQKGPFGGEVGYACVDVDRAGPFALLQEARAVANGDPVNIGYLCGSIYCTGFPGYVRQFNRAFLSLPALPSHLVENASSDPAVVVRRIPTERNGTYYVAVNTSMQDKRGMEIKLPGAPALEDLLNESTTINGTPRLDLYPGELRTFHSP